VTTTWLGASGGNEHIAALLAEDEVRLDRIKVGAWMSDEQLAALCAARPALLHISRGAIWPRGRRWGNEQLRLVRLTRAPWVSFHLDIGLPYSIYRWPLPQLIPPRLARRWAARTLRRLTAQSPVPVLAENMPRWSRDRPAYVVDPAFISGVIEEANCGLLLDLAHARVAAAMRKEPVRDYISRLPLDRLTEVHISGPRLSPRRKLLVDAHETLQEEDYDLLRWVLQRAQPRAVTLEYTRNREMLKEQLLNLDSLLSS
jgi:uncharacterized protein (UPF0276 family)